MLRALYSPRVKIIFLVAGSTNVRSSRMICLTLSLSTSVSESYRKSCIPRRAHLCRQCQPYGKAPGRFKFKLPKEYNFNHTVVLDIVKLEGDNILQIIDEATNYQAGQFLTDKSTATVWNAFRASHIDTYPGPPDFTFHDVSTNLA